MASNGGLYMQIDNFHSTKDGLGNDGNTSPMTLDATIRTITLPKSANSVTLHPDEPMRVGFDLTMANGYFVISAPYTMTFAQSHMTAIYYRTDAAIAQATSKLGTDFGQH